MTLQQPAKTMSIGGATYDIFVRVNHETSKGSDGHPSFSLPLGGKVPIEEVVETCGGGALNTSVGFSRLGCNASFEGVIGSDQWGQRLLETLRNEGTDVRYATIVEGEISSFSLILLAKNGDRVILYEPGTNEHLQKSNFDVDIASQMDWVYLNHIQEQSTEIEDDIVAMLTRDESPRFTWNPGGNQITQGIDSETNCRLLKYTDVLLLNDEEALAFARTDSIEQALRILRKVGAKTICITEGKNGVTATDGVNVYHCPTLPIAKVVDTTGAGDAFGTGVSWALLQAMDFPIALQAGTINAASVISAIGAQKGLLTDTQMREQLAKTGLTVEVHPL